jgi:hypothetical protein
MLETLAMLSNVQPQVPRAILVTSADQTAPGTPLYWFLQDWVTRVTIGMFMRWLNN